ncbi:hypothetical protein CHH80_18190 [Bacillus sp. 7504-2]|nr:hypothetical protein CHH80_18190 [Bacillus sp. 7504-2]
MIFICPYRKISRLKHFQQLYSNELKKWLHLQKEIAEDDEIECEPFNRERAIEQFHEGFIYNQELLKKKYQKQFYQT